MNSRNEKSVEVQLGSLIITLSLTLNENEKESEDFITMTAKRKNIEDICISQIITIPPHLSSSSNINKVYK
jgi:hypothetical protein